MNRRLPGEGTIRERGDGRWEVRLVFPEGKRYAYARSKLEAVERLREMQRDAVSAAPKTPARLTVAAFTADWLQTVRPTVRPSTFRCYERVVRLHIVAHIGTRRIAKLTPRDVSTWLASLTSAGLSPRSVQLARTVLRMALQRGMEWGDVARNVVDVVPGPKLERAPVDPWSAEEAERFLLACRGDHLEALWVCAITLGLRQGELLGLRWQDVDLDAGEIRVVQARLRSRPGEPMFGEPKSRQSRRTLPLPAITADALREHRQRQRLMRLAAGPEWVDSGLVFTSHEGRPLDAPNVGRSFRTRIARHGLRPVRFHDLRHCAASLLLRQGVGLREIMEWLGHSQIAITADLYAHVAPAMKRDAAARMNAVFNRQLG